MEKPGLVPGFSFPHVEFAGQPMVPVEDRHVVSR